MVSFTAPSLPAAGRKKAHPISPKEAGYALFPLAVIFIPPSSVLSL